MSIHMLDTTMFIVVMAGSGMFWYWHFRCIFAVKGSRQRYIAATLRLVGAMSIIAGGLVGAMTCILMDDYGMAGIYGFDALVYTFWIWFNRNDDNWFNDQWKRLKRGFKKLKQRLASIKLSPIPLPSPA